MRLVKVLLCLLALLAVLPAAAEAPAAAAPPAEIQTDPARMTPAPQPEAAGDLQPPSVELAGGIGEQTHFCTPISSWCESCGAGKIRSCTRYRCQVGPDVWYETHCTSCANFC